MNIFESRARSITLLLLAWRNIWRHRRRNSMLFAAILVAVSTIVLANALIRGWQADILDAVVENLTGHVKVLAPGSNTGTIYDPRTGGSSGSESGGTIKLTPKIFQKKSR